MKLINTETQTEINLEGTLEEYDAFLRLLDVFEPDQVIGILEHYDLCNWC